MAKMYYLYSKEKRCEAVYVCDDDKYIDNATLQTGVYPFGVILSKAVKLLSSCLANKHSPFIGKGEHELSEKFLEFSLADSSFSSVVCDDPAVQTVLKLLLIDRQHLEEDMEKYDHLSELLRRYAEYIDLCQENKEFCKSESLRLLSEQNLHSLPRQSIYTAKKVEKETVLTKAAMAELLKKCDSPEQFAPGLKKPWKTLWELRSPISEIRTTEWAPLKPPIHVFDVHDIVDLILASLQCVFEEGYIIRKCFYCGGLFVTHKGNQKYCPAPVNTTKYTSCYQLAKLQRQLEKEKSVSVKMHKSIRTMLAAKCNTNDKQKYNDYLNNYLKFLEESQVWRDKIKAKEATEEEYVAWLETHHKRKNRGKRTAAET